MKIIKLSQVEDGADKWHSITLFHEETHRRTRSGTTVDPHNNWVLHGHPSRFEKVEE